MPDNEHLGDVRVSDTVKLNNMNINLASNITAGGVATQKVYLDDEVIWQRQTITITIPDIPNIVIGGTNFNRKKTINNGIGYGDTVVINLTEKDSDRVVTSFKVNGVTYTGSSATLENVTENITITDVVYQDKISGDPLWIRSREDENKFTFDVEYFKGGQYSLDGASWINMDGGEIELKKDQIMYIRADGFVASTTGRIHSTGTFDAGGDPSSLNSTELTSLFDSTLIVNAGGLKIGAQRCTFMFYKCHNLEVAPELPRTELADYCYQQMFTYCTSLVEAPTLPATKLVYECYDRMFYGCKKLSHVKAMFVDAPVNIMTSSWLYDVAPEGIFEMNPEATWNPDEYRGTDGIPTGWKVIGYKGDGATAGTEIDTPVMNEEEEPTVVG